MDQRLRPVGIHEQIMRRADTAVEIAVGFVHDQRQPVRPRDLHNARITSAGYSAPQGLFGDTSTIARVRGVISARAACGSGIIPPRI